MNITLYLMLSIAATGFGLSLLVETTSWSLRAMSSENNHGFFNARANIYLYGGRFFSLLFMMIISLLVDKQINSSHVILFVAISVTCAAIIQFFYWRSILFFNYLNKIIAHLFLHKVTGLKSIRFHKKIDQKLFLNTLFASSILVLGVTSPYILASVYPEVRMTISTLGQVINAIGTLILLFSVDPILFRKMDTNSLHTYIFSYIKGRCFGLIFASIIFWITYFIF